MTAPLVADLDERSLLLALQEVTEELTAETPPEALPMDQDEANALLTALLQAGGHGGTGLAELDEYEQYAAARRVLVALAEDPGTRAAAAPVLADPPADTRLGADLAVPALAAVAGVVAWLQTKVDVRIKRKDGKTEFEFRVVKEAASAGLLKELAGAVLRLWNGPPQQ
ncbi:hypothetical protein OHT76_32940 [Streptomyces sp. NBC_00287]|uniref:hypothetical protein n=1 Tax=Streptomyces sp. NBC_00287 TaxID=2975702 RepID=UPI002E2C63E3|nr:hypothetical protein [Streptomyces sp. NBC_00287]